jgi:hypothetical protein
MNDRKRILYIKKEVNIFIDGYELDALMHAKLPGTFYHITCEKGVWNCSANHENLKKQCKHIREIKKQLRIGVAT